MVDKAQRHNDRGRAAEHSAEQLEQAVLKQFQAGRLPAKTAAQQLLDNEFEPLHSQKFGSISVTGGARRASRAADDGVDGAGETRGEGEVAESSHSMLTSAAFASGMLIMQDGATPKVGQALGSADRAFAEDKPKENGIQTALDPDLSSELRTAPEMERVSVYDYVEAATGLPLVRQGTVPTIRQEESMKLVRDLAGACPALEQLNRPPDSMLPGIREAVASVMHMALPYVVVRVDAQNMRDAAENNQKQPLAYPRSVSMRFQGQVSIPIDPSELLTLAA
jgi:hypothetical protein